MLAGHLIKPDRQVVVPGGRGCSGSLGASAWPAEPRFRERWPCRWPEFRCCNTKEARRAFYAAVTGWRHSTAIQIGAARQACGLPCADRSADGGRAAACGASRTNFVSRCAICKSKFQRSKPPAANVPSNSRARICCSIRRVRATCLQYWIKIGWPPRAIQSPGRERPHRAILRPAHRSVRVGV